MMARIWLITEDSTDANIVQRLLDQRGMAIHVKQLEPEGNARGISVLARQLEKLIKVALHQRGPHDCIAVLHDADEHTQLTRTDYNKIRDICEKYRESVALIVARQAIESWLLADGGLCQWLGQRPRNHNEDSNPKDLLVSLLREKKLKWQGRDRERVLEHLHGDGDKFSPSMLAAVAHLHNAPCAINKA
jgi:hypothetical protein